MLHKQEIDTIVNSFFSIFDNTNQKQPAWESIYNTCVPETVIIKKTGLDHEIYNLETFIGPRKKILSDGTLTGFSEMEMAEETKIIGNIAQRFSKYTKKGYLNGEYFEGGGNKFFQLIHTTGGWKINSVLWEDD